MRATEPVPSPVLLQPRRRRGGAAGALAALAGVVILVSGGCGGGSGSPSLPPQQPPPTPATRPTLDPTYRASGHAAAGDVFVHLFEWRWNDIATECEGVLGPAGYAAV